MEQIWDLILYNFVGFLIIFARVAGIFTFNPIFGRQNVPMRVRTSMTLVLAVCMVAGMNGTVGYIPESATHLVFIVISEAIVGLVFGFMTNMFLNVLILAGQTIDSQVGFSMANVFDPGTGITMPVTANLFYYLFIFYFFLTNGHLEYIKMFSISYGIIPIGFEFTWNTAFMARSIVEYMGTVFVLAVKLAMPILAAELISQACIGVIMKAVPGISVLIINFQIKILIGLFMLMALAAPMANFVDGLLRLMWQNLDSLLNRFI